MLFPQNVKELLERAAAYGDRSAYLFRAGRNTVSKSFASFYADCSACAAFLCEAGMAGRTVAVDARSTYEMIVAAYAAMAVGAVALLLNFDLPEADLRRAMRMADAKMLIYDRMDSDYAAEFADCLGGRCVSGSSARILGAPFPSLVSPLSEDAPAAIILTSGSTSQSKLVLLSQAGVIFNTGRAAERVMSVLPFYHVAGFKTVTEALMMGSCNILSGFKTALRDIAEFRPQYIVSVPAVISDMIRDNRDNGTDIGCLRRVVTCGAPQRTEDVHFLADHGIRIDSVYGATETSGPVTYIPEDGHIGNGSVGLAAGWNEIKIGAGGEVLVRGRNVMLCYVGDPEATAEALTDGWYHTGDVGSIDSEGYLYIEGRLNDIIILSNGENVSKVRLEDALYCCPLVKETVVYEKDDSIEASVYYGDMPDADTENEIRTFIRSYNRSVPSYYRIAHPVFRYEPFEKTASGKIRRT